MLTLTNLEHHLLEWLGREETSLYGECRGRNLDALLSAGLAEFDGAAPEDPDRLAYGRVRLTEEGKKKLAEVGPWQPGKLL